MKQTFKSFLLLAFGLGAMTFSSCSDESGDDPDPIEVITCQLIGVGEVADGESYNTTFTYDADGNLTKRSDPDGDMTFTYVDGKITTIGFDGEVATVTYDGNSLPYRMELTEDGETFYFIMKSENGRYVTIEDHYVVDGEDELQGVTNITYDASGNVSSVKTEEYDWDSEKFTEVGSVTKLSFDDKKNPYITSPALMVYELLDGDEANLSVNNPVTYTYNYGSETDVSNSYTYNDEGYPTKRDETGFSSPATYNFAYNCK